MARSTTPATSPRHAEDWGYRRFWVAEHHNMPGIASAATSVVIAHIAAGTQRIRVGAGGIMLPNHSPLVIAEQFGTLARSVPGPHRPRPRARARHRPADRRRACGARSNGVDNFPQDVLELQSYFCAGPRRVSACRRCRAAGHEVPLWILGSSPFGAQLAAELGLPYAFASHFAPDRLDAGAGRSIARASSPPRSSTGRMRWSASTSSPPRPTREARRLLTTQQMAFTNIFRGSAWLSQPPIDDIETYWTPIEKAQVTRMLARSHRRLAGDGAHRHRRTDRRDGRRRADGRVGRLRPRHPATFVRADSSGARGRRRAAAMRPGLSRHRAHHAFSSLVLDDKPNCEAPVVRLKQRAPVE